MKYYKRQLTNLLKRAVKTFPAVIVTGPRQSGKTTLLKKEFGEKAGFVSLEQPDKRLWAAEDPVGFLENYTPPVIIDEFQYVPGLLPYIKEKIDVRRIPGSYFLTGSQQFSVMKNVSESLAGRAAITSLLPFSISELKQELYGSWEEWFNSLFSAAGKALKGTQGEIIINGFYPEIANNKQVDRNLWFSSYTQTYLERDIKTLYDIGNLNNFSKFTSLLAARCGSILNYSSFASDIGVSVPTIKSWFSILEASFIVFKIMPYFKNSGKRIIKAPKFYFFDTGLAAHLAGINSPEYLVRSSIGGQYFENMVMSDFMKNRLSHNENINLFYLNQRNLWEIDLLIERNLSLMPVEIKLTGTVSGAHLENFGKLREMFNNIADENYLVCGAAESMKMGKSRITSWRYL
jgi:predicted AAA+ superfamily ATPase